MKSNHEITDLNHFTGQRRIVNEMKRRNVEDSGHPLGNYLKDLQYWKDGQEAPLNS